MMSDLKRKEINFQDILDKMNSITLSDPQVLRDYAK